jgi:hypothetical protein
MRGSGVGEQWAMQASTEGPGKILYGDSELGLGWGSPEAIGRRGRCVGAALCTECREANGSVGG